MSTIIEAVYHAFDVYEPRVLNRCWLSLLMNYNMVLTHQGSNHYKQSHMYKDKLEKERNLPITIPVVSRLIADFDDYNNLDLHSEWQLGNEDISGLLNGFDAEE